MAEPIIMPKAGMAMEEGVIIQWLKKEGDVIEKGEPVLEIETDKVTMEVEADDAGTLLKVLYPDGTTVPVTKTIAWVGEVGEEIPEEEADVPVVEVATAAPVAVPVAASPANVPAPRRDGKLASTPAAKRLAQENGIDLATVTPTGKHGEIIAPFSRSSKNAASLCGPWLAINFRLTSASPMAQLNKTNAWPMRFAKYSQPDGHPCEH
ncbi:hypothetical protein BVY04_02645 [bacterium M21]|nr:hypothetical protein BVY04_02645 [bacterium M21]